MYARVLLFLSWTCLPHAMQEKTRVTGNAEWRASGSSANSLAASLAVVRLRGGSAPAASVENSAVKRGEPQLQAPLGKRRMSPSNAASPDSIIEHERDLDDHSGTMRGGLVVFPYDCGDFHEAIQRCDAECDVKGMHDGIEQQVKRKRYERSSSELPTKQEIEEERKGLTRIKKLLVQYGRHEVGEDAIDIRTSGEWSISGIGDLSDEVDLALLQTLVAHIDTFAARNKNATSSSALAALQQRVSAKCSVIAQIIAPPQGRGAAAADPSDSTWGSGRMLEIALPNISWPLLPPDRFNSRQALLQMQLACDSLANTTTPFAQVGSRSSSSSSSSTQSSPYKIRTHKHIKNNPFDVLLQPPEETEVIGRWQMRAGTRGALRQLIFSIKALLRLY